MCRRVLFVFAVCCFAPVLAVADNSSPKSIKRSWRERQQALIARHNGQKVAADQVEQMQILIKADKLEIKPDGKGRKTTFRLDSSRTPKTIDLTPLDGDRKGRHYTGIYSLQEGTLRLCVNIWGKDPAQRPTQFKTQTGDGYVLLLLRRAQPK